MSARKVKAVETTVETVEIPDVVGLIGEVPVEVIDKENKIVDLESEVIRLQDRIKDIRKELRGLEGKTKREGPTKMDNCREMFKENPGLARKEYVKLFMDKAGLSLAAARTYTQIILSKAKEAAKE